MQELCESLPMGTELLPKPTHTPDTSSLSCEWPNVGHEVHLQQQPYLVYPGGVVSNYRVLVSSVATNITFKE
jgi:hypothetical protein